MKQIYKCFILNQIKIKHLEQYLQNLKHLAKNITMTVLFGFEINRLI